MRSTVNVMTGMKGTIMRPIGTAITLLCFMANLATAEEYGDSESGKKLSISGRVEVETAEMVKARSSKGGGDNAGQAVTVDHIWYGHTIGTINLSSNPLEYFTVRSSFEFRQYMTMYPVIPRTEGNYVREPMFGQAYWNGFYIREFQGIFSLLKNERLAFDLALGYMPYKYNPEVRDMGEFLFRSGTYPLFLINEYNRPFARLTGLRAGFKYTGESVEAHIDVLAQVERELRPFNDVSLGAVAGVNVLKIVDIGGGIDFAHCIPLDSRFTSKKNADPLSFPYMDEARYIIYNSDSSVADTGYYTFTGTKLMLRATIDPLGMVRGDKESIVSKIFGENGGKIYGEYAIIGLKNYPASKNPTYNPLGYRNIAERSPYMVGFNVPLWKILDECTIEFERWPSYYPDNYYMTTIIGGALPTNRNSNPGLYDSTVYVPRWLWSLNMKRRISENIALVCQMGRNHQRWEFHPAAGLFYDLEAAFVRPDEWGWHLSAVISF